MNENSGNEEKTSFDYEKHWNAAYQKSPIAILGWYEENYATPVTLKSRLPATLNKNVRFQV
ncbi:MAG: hypothetical protein Q7U59_12860 [Lutibacter sp.]|nr:hypothetical protein [Lutibacter sp.]